MNKFNQLLQTKGTNPFIQVGFLLTINVILMLLGKIISGIGLVSMSDVFPWTTATSLLLFFAIFNSVISLSSDDLNKYWGRSMLAFVVLAVLSGLLAYLFSSMSIHEAGAYKWIYFVLSFGYLVFLSILGFMKRIVDFAEREDWQAPRKKSR